MGCNGNCQDCPWKITCDTEIYGEGEENID